MSFLPRDVLSSDIFQSIQDFPQNKCNHFPEAPLFWKGAAWFHPLWYIWIYSLRSLIMQVLLHAAAIQNNIYNCQTQIGILHVTRKLLWATVLNAVTWFKQKLLTTNSTTKSVILILNFSKSTIIVEKKDISLIKKRRRESYIRDTFS